MSLLRSFRPRLPRVPRAALLAGNYHQWNDAPFEFSRRCERDFYGIADLRFGLRSVYLVTAPDLIEEILTTQNKSFEKGLGHEEPRALFGDGLLTADNATWRTHRKVVSPFFHASRMDGYGKRIEASARAAAARWRDGETRNVYRDMNVLCLGVFMQSIFGSEVPGAAEQVTNAVKVLHRAHNRWTYDSAAFRETAEGFDEFVEGVIETFRSERKDAKDLVNVLLAAHAADPDVMTRKHVRDQVATMIFAGFETTASAISWTLYLLARHPTVAAALRTELDEVVGERSLGELPPHALPRLYAVLCEVLRLYPPAHRLSRRATKLVQLGGHAFPAGTDFIIPTWAVHRSPRHYGEPDAFRPERWTAEMRATLPRFAYFPFGGGPRTCIGQTLAFREMAIIVSTIVSRFDLEAAFAGDKAPYNGITLVPAGGDMQLRFRARRASRASAPFLRSRASAAAM